MIAYEDGSTGLSHRSLFVLDLATGESKQVADDSHGGGLQFTPGGSQVVYTAGREVSSVRSDLHFRNPEIRAAPVAGGESTFVFGNATANASFSPDGSRVTFFSIRYPTREGRCEPCRLVANADSTEGRLVRGCYFSNPAGTWSPDGRRIVCWRGRGIRNNKVVVVDMTTGRPSRVAKGGSAVWVDNHTLLVEP
jgi:Tol biopolymer transport system component